MTSAEEFAAKHKGKKARYTGFFTGRIIDGVVKGADNCNPKLIRLQVEPGREELFYWRDLEILNDGPLPKAKSCECGANKIGCNKHSSWCPLV